MSYIKPKLIEPKIAKLIINKLDKKKNIINEINIVQDGGSKIPFHKQILNYLLLFLKNNYILIIIILLIIILLYVRYIETSKRKEQMMKIIEQNDD